jgi:hypothetical protein
MYLFDGGNTDMKEYPCRMSRTKQCKYGGAKIYNYGFLSGASEYCRKEKKFICDMQKCPLVPPYGDET